MKMICEQFLQRVANAPSIVSNAIIPTPYNMLNSLAKEARAILVEAKQMSDRNGLPKGEFNLPPGVSARDIPGELDDVDTLLESLGKYISPDDVELDQKTFLGLVRDRITEDLDAPDMLNALRGLFEHCAMVHKHWGEDSNQREADAAIKIARAAIAKAEGRL